MKKDIKITITAFNKPSTEAIKNTATYLKSLVEKLKDIFYKTFIFCCNQ